MCVKVTRARWLFRIVDGKGKGKAEGEGYLNVPQNASESCSSAVQHSP